MRRLLAMLGMCVACGSAAAVEIRQYDTRLEVSPDGAAQATASLELTGATAGRLRVPVGFASLDAFRPAGMPAGITMTPRTSGSTAWVDVELPEDVPANLKLGFSFRVPGALVVPKPEEGQKSAYPAGSRILRHGFVNTQEAPIGRYRMKVLLPEETIVQAIREQLPKPRRKEFLPRVELDRYEGRQGALLQFNGLRQGDRTSMELEVVDRHRSMLWLVVLLPIAGGYLFAFRDLVKPGQA